MIKIFNNNIKIQVFLNLFVFIFIFINPSNSICFAIESICYFSNQRTNTQIFDTVNYVSCDSAMIVANIPINSTEVKKYHLRVLVLRNDSGQSNGDITLENIDSMVVKANRYFYAWKIEFCYSVVFIDNSKYLTITGNYYNDSIYRNLIDTYAPFSNDMYYAIITDIPTLGQSGNPLLIDYTAVAGNNYLGGLVLAHEQGHNFGLLHVSDTSNVMYSSTGSSNPKFDSLQAGKMHCNMAVIENLYAYNGISGQLTFGKIACNNQGVPYARLFANKNGGCSPLTIQFLDSSSFEPIKWFWDFGDGYSDTTKNPLHVYSTSGIYTITKIISNSFGSDTITMSNFIKVMDTLLPLTNYENFDNIIFPPDNWYINNYDTKLTWEKSSNIYGSYSNPTCARVGGGIYGTAWRQIDDLITPSYDFTYAINPFLTFNVAYPFDASFDDTLNVYASLDCGKSFSLLYSNSNSISKLFCELGYYDSATCKTFGFDTLKTLGTKIIDSIPYGYLFIPTVETDWRNDTINFKMYSGEPNVNFKFEYKRGYTGNYLYLDDIYISADKISGLPVADFKADTTTIYKYDTVRFTNLSTFSDTLQWLFTGATIASTQDTNPSIVYDSAGIFSVTLVVWNLFGRDTLTKLAYINVLQKIIDTIPCDSMKISLSKNDVNCKGKNDGTVTASAFNGNSDYSFSWSTGDTTNSISGLAAGSYAVTITDSIGCTKTAYITITEPPILSSNLAYSNVSCLGGNDGNAVVSTYGGNGSYSYLWSTGDTINIISDLTTGTYTVTVTDSIGCVKTDSIKISYIDSLPAADFSYTDTGYAVIFTNLSTNADSYLWQFGDDSTDNSSNPTHIYTDFGTYEACLIALNNCGADTLCKSISIIEGIKENTGKINLQIFPNPNSGTFTIIVEQSKASEIQITLTNILGQNVYTNKVTAKIFKDELNLTNFGKGVYSLKVVTNNTSVSKKVVYR